MQRAILWASVILLAQLGLVVALHLTDGNTESLPRGEKLVFFVPETVERIRLQDAEGETLVLRRREGGWNIDGGGGLQVAADGKQAEELLQKLAGLKQGVAVATSKEAAERFEVSPENFAYRLVLEEKEGEAAEVYFGTSAGFNQMHSRVAGRGEIVSVPMGGHEVAPLVEQWIDRDILKLDTEKLVRLDFDRLTLLRLEDGGWQVDRPQEGTGMGAEEARELAEAASGLTVHGYYAPGQQQEEVAKDEVMEFTTVDDDGRSLRWRIAGEENWYAVARSDRDIVFKVSGWQIEELQKLLEGGKGEKEAGDHGIDNGGQQGR